jgi:uncharacterized protein YbjT (DUF2867 family)
MIVVMGATGHTGGQITGLLLQAGEKVRALGRSQDKLAPLRMAGAQTLAGDATDPAFLSHAFGGASAVYTLLPPNPQSKDFRAEQDRVGEATAQAIRANAIRHVVLLSSVGADLPSGTGPIAGLHAQEDRLRGITGTNVLFLRAAYFFENFYATLGLIRNQGINGGAGTPSVAIPMVATRDIAEVAARALIARDWNGVVVREVLGPRDLSQAEATRILGERLGKPNLEYVQFTYEDTIAALVGMGLSENVAGQYVEMARAFNDGLIKSCYGRNEASTTPTRFEDFADELARASMAA